MRNSSHIVFTLIAAAVIAWGVAHFSTPQTVGTNAAAKETAYQRVLRTKTLRCGYVVYPPLLKKDANTGEMSGIGHDIVERIATLTQLKIEWTMETNWANYTLDLQGGKFDALCTLDFFPPVLVGRVATTQPLFLTTMGVYKRAGDPRFPIGFRAFNEPKIKISALDGSISMLLRNADYPKADLLTMPATSDYSIILENVASGKADLTFVERAVANNYIKANPGKIEEITGDANFVAYPYILPVARGEDALAHLFDQAIMLLHFNGEIRKIVNRYAAGNYLTVDPYAPYTAR
jgi:ABC-type amino acid transport substrate-binding protein